MGNYFSFTSSDFIVELICKARSVKMLICYCTCNPGQSLDKVAQEIVEKDVLGLK